MWKPLFVRPKLSRARNRPMQGNPGQSWILDSMMWIPDSGYWIPDSSTVDSGFQKEPDFIFFPVLMLFFALRFRVRILLYWKTLLEGITSLFSFSIYKITGRNVLQFRKGYGIIMRGTLGDCLHRNTAEKNNKHRITAKKRSETPTSQFKVLSYD